MSRKVSADVGVSRKLRIATFGEPASAESGPTCLTASVLMLSEWVEVGVVCVEVVCVVAVEVVVVEVGVVDVGVVEVGVVDVGVVEVGAASVTRTSASCV